MSKQAMSSKDRCGFEKVWLNLASRFTLLNSCAPRPSLHLHGQFPGRTPQTGSFLLTFRTIALELFTDVLPLFLVDDGENSGDGFTDSVAIRAQGKGRGID